jgi:hypothetical protein
MNTAISVISPIEGEVLRDALLDADDMCSMNFARDEFNNLAAILLGQIVPALGGYHNSQLACEISRHVEQVRIFSGNFCWRHRHLGASFGVVGKRPGIDVEVRP